jgi:8-oxo-dGTP diphosphatase
MTAPGSPRLVVGAAIRDPEGRLLAAQRSAPRSFAGKWEFPGGKVESYETPEQALTRECLEELGIVIEVGEMLGEVTIAIGRLQVYFARVTAGVPQAREHAALRWLGPAELDDVDWIDADRPLVQRLARSTLQ